MALEEVVVRAELDRVGNDSVFAKVLEECVGMVPVKVAEAVHIVVCFVAVADAVVHLWVSRERASIRLGFHFAGDGVGMIAVEHLWGWHRRMRKVPGGCRMLIAGGGYRDLMFVVVHYLMPSLLEGHLLDIEVVAVGMEGLGWHTRRVGHYSEVGIEASGYVILLEHVIHGHIIVTGDNLPGGPPPGPGV